jgi:hypothetical protein
VRFLYEPTPIRLLAWLHNAAFAVLVGTLICIFATALNILPNGVTSWVNFLQFALMVSGVVMVLARKEIKKRGYVEEEPS